MNKPLLFASLLWLFAAPALAADPETLCQDGQDNDGDTVMDCGDSDCKADPACKPDGNPEDTDARCSDWVDNDSDGATDCDDSDCDAVKTCGGSFKAPDAPVATASATTDELPTLGEGMTVQDLIGRGKDVDGERNDELCADGIDNDGDGMTDCADYGCRFDDSVSVCRGNPGLRFSVVGMINQEYDMEEKFWDTRFSRLQLRSFGPIPQIQNSFFMINMLVERTPRLTYAMFSVPIAEGGHTLSINSGAAGLNQIQAISIHKQLLIERPTIFRAFEGYNSAAVEVSGPLTDDGKILYRAFAGGGAGRYDGNVGGRTVSSGTDDNYTWAAGGQLHFNLIGYYSRFDTPFLYTPVPLTLGLLVGAKYDEREQERYPSLNVHSTLRWDRLLVMAEAYTKRELEFKSWQTGYMAQAGFLVIPKYLMIAADYGAFIAGDMDSPPEADEWTSDLRKIRDEYQYRGALHYYAFRNIGLLSLVYQKRVVKEGNGYDDQTEQSVQLVSQFRF